MKLLLALMASLLIVGCASTSLYQWGSYENDLYKSYKDADKAEVLLVSLEAQISAQEIAKTRTPPGLYAELGTLYLQKGDTQKAKQFYAKERDAWPESQTLMDAMIKNLERLAQTKKDSK